MPTVQQALLAASRQLSAHSSSPRLDAEVILAYLLGWQRAALLARGDTLLEPRQEEEYATLVSRRAKGEPVAYITGVREFYWLDLVMTPDVLVPRPETESVVDACLEAIPPDRDALLADIGTGSGAIVVATCKQRPRLKAYATDVSAAAVEVARANATRHGVQEQITFFVGDLLAPLPGPVHVLAANLPYVSPGEAAPDVATWEPHVAVFGGGEDGTETIRRFLVDAPRYLCPEGRVVMETAYSQGAEVSRLAGEAFPGSRIEVRKDLAGYDRIVVIQT